MTQPFNLKSCSFFATFVKWSLSYKSKPQIHWNTDDVHIQAIISITTSAEYPFPICVCAFFSILCSSGSAGKKHTHDVLFPPCPMPSVMGRTGEAGGRECT